MIRSNLNVINNSSITDQLKDKLQNHEFDIYTGHEVITIDGNFIKKFVTKINTLVVVPTGYYGDFTSNDMQMLTNSLSTSKKVCFVAYLFLFKSL